MAVQISGALLNGAGIPMSGCHIILKSRVNTSEVVMRTVADVVTGNNGEYSFEAQAGKYCVYLKQEWRDEYCVGDISVYYDSEPGTLNDFLTALNEGDLKPDVVARFEEMLAQAKQSAEEAGQHAADAQQAKNDCQTLAEEVQQNADAVAEDKKQITLLASSASQDAARAEQAAKDADKIVDKAVDKLGEAATLTGEAKASAEAAARSEQNAKQSAEAISEAVTAIMDEMKTKAPLDSPALTGTPTTPTPPLDASGCEIANAEFVRALIAATPSGSYSTDSVIPLVINRAQLQSAHQSHEPLVINRAQLQSGYLLKACEPLIISGAQLQSAHQSHEPLMVNRMGLSFAFIRPLQTL